MNGDRIVVIGGGHAGVEAAAAGARLGVPSLLMTMRRGDIGEMSCNPSVGGLGKGQLVKELDALGGLMGRAIDKAGIQFRTLNAGKGAAVRASRAQADRALYKKELLSLLEQQRNLEIKEGEVASIELERDRVAGVALADGSFIPARAVILTAGTFLGGLMHTGPRQWRGGRYDDRPSLALSANLKALGLPLGRLKTGTPARLRMSTIDFSGLQEQAGEVPARPFSMMSNAINRPQMPCWLTATNEKAHEIIRRNRERSPLFNGQIKSGGPRYCPSIEDKVFRFAERDHHTVFLEPEGYDCDVIYPNGISTSLPADVQNDFIREIRGLEKVEILRYGYAIEYDYLDPTHLAPTLESKDIKGFFIAGQVNGTSGYEEAAAQGLVAGANAALHILEREPLLISRADAYVGVMIDDLISKGVDEPYRMFTSRAEYRLLLREDNAPFRLCPLGNRAGLISETQQARFETLVKELQMGRDFLSLTRIKSDSGNNDWLASFGSAPLKETMQLAELVRRPELRLSDLLNRFPQPGIISSEVAMTLETEFKFSGYIARQEEEILRLKKAESELIPPDFPYDDVEGLRAEYKEKLKRYRPHSLGQAMRVPGMTPGAISVLAVSLKRMRRSFAKA